LIRIKIFENEKVIDSIKLSKRKKTIEELFDDLKIKYG